MASERRFKDAIRTFADDADAAESEHAAAGLARTGTDPGSEAERRQLAAGFAATVDELIELLNAECSAVRAQDMEAIAAFADGKEAALSRLEAILVQARARDVSLREDHNGSSAELRLARFDDAVKRNMAVLDASRDAVLKVNGAMVKAVEAEFDDGVYGRQGRSLKPQEISTAGLHFEV